MFTAILALLSLPALDFSKLRGMTFKPAAKLIFWIFVANFLALMILGAKHVETPYIELGQICTFFYFAYFLLLVPTVSLFENVIVALSSSSPAKGSEKIITLYVVINLNLYTLKVTMKLIKWAIADIVELKKREYF